MRIGFCPHDVVTSEMLRRFVLGSLCTAEMQLRAYGIHGAFKRPQVSRRLCPVRRERESGHHTQTIPSADLMLSGDQRPEFGLGQRMTRDRQTLVRAR